MCIFLTSQYVCKKSDSDKFKRIITRLFPLFDIKETEGTHDDKIIINMKFSLTYNLYGIIPKKPNPNLIKKQCDQNILQTLENFIDNNDNFYENCRYLRLQNPISKEQLELALIHCPRIIGYYFHYKNQCIITFKDHVYIISYSENNECPTWSNITNHLFIYLDLDDGFSYHNPFDNNKSNGIEKSPVEIILDSFNRCFNKWKKNGMEGDILVRDDSHLFSLDN
ncbi:hypothetical protein Catovirus_1_1009 [Catovirus CTV1]|uniref:Uncharacterized protein n=1 Tax=Catovirus CTV1 TaxID=1977631 RepID=A0A1V0SB83_9VIRU|nr:hypothetical protein Catovirus_1_1009 [Catovirus CTV1]